MEIKKENIDNIVKYINIELKNNKESSVNKLCNKIGIKQSTFKAWVRNAGYSFNIEERAYTKVKHLYKEDNKTKVIQKNNGLDIKKLQELIELLEPLQEIVKEHTRNKNIIEVKKAELNPPSITEVKQKLFKIDVDTLKNWEKFVAEHKQYKVQNLITLAIKEFLEKYK